ncbi:transposase [Pseudomonas sp. ES3-33]|uniref:transposase n=1 Tax=Pseudomonas sp. ES3-33 TaxID=1628833 RepID=UPI0022A94512|nr:transposase [Pseudomonas sp. ES3-33]
MRLCSDAQWAKMEPHCVGKLSDPRRRGTDNRCFIEAMLWIARTGNPWRDLPSHFGKWSTVFKHFCDWVMANVFKRHQPRLSIDAKMTAPPVSVYHFAITL